MCASLIHISRYIGKDKSFQYVLPELKEMRLQPLLDHGETSADFRSACLDAEVIVTLAKGLQAYFPEAYREVWSAKTQTIVQGAQCVDWDRTRINPSLAVVIGHLRPIKDPWLPVNALRSLVADEASSSLLPLEICHYGGLLEGEGEQKVATIEEQFEGSAQRWCWKREASIAEIRELMTEGPLLIHPSIHEGGANVIGEFLVSGLPILASRAPGNVGLLGEDWPGLFDVGDQLQLANLLRRWLESEVFREELIEASGRLSAQHDLFQEREAWSELLSELENRDN